MKKLALALSGVAVLFAVKPASAGPYIYDTFTPGGPAYYSNAGHSGFMGDILIPTSYGPVCSVSGRFVATKAGNFTIDVMFFGSRCLGGFAGAPCALPSAAFPFPVTIPPPPGTFPAVYDITFPIDPNYVWSPVPGESIIGIAFRVRETGLVPTATDLAPVVGTGFNGFSVDRDNDQCLRPGFPTCPVGTEWFNFTANPPWTNGNMIVAINTNCELPAPNVPIVELSPRNAIPKALVPVAVVEDSFRN